MHDFEFGSLDGPVTNSVWIGIHHARAGLVVDPGPRKGGTHLEGAVEGIAVQKISSGEVKSKQQPISISGDSKRKEKKISGDSVTCFSLAFFPSSQIHRRHGGLLLWISPR